MADATSRARLAGALLLAATLAGCIGPFGQWPGLRLSGERAAVPADWSFANEHREVALQVTPPYRVPHSVTIWCAADGDALYVAARSPEQKRWPGWVESRPDVRLRIGGRVYEVTLQRIDETQAAELARARRAYTAKYDLPSRPAGDAPALRYWRVARR